MSEVFRGIDTVGGPRRRVIGSPTQGRSIEYTYEGTLESMVWLTNSLPAGTDFVLDETNAPKSTLVIRVQGLGVGDTNPILNITYDLDSSMQQKSILEHWRTLRIHAADSTAIARIKKAIDDLRKNPDASIPGFSGDQLQLFYQLKLGQDYYFTPQPVMTINVYAVRNREVDAAYSSAGAIFTTAQMIEEIGGSDVPQPYPVACAAAEASMIAQVGGTAFVNSLSGTYLLGWLKSGPTIKTVGGNKSVMTITYTLDIWSLYNYDTVV